MNITWECKINNGPSMHFFFNQSWIPSGMQHNVLLFIWFVSRVNMNNFSTNHFRTFLATNVLCDCLFVTFTLIFFFFFYIIHSQPRMTFVKNNLPKCVVLELYMIVIV